MVMVFWVSSCMFLKNAPSDCQVHPMVVVHQAAASSDSRWATSPDSLQKTSLCANAPGIQEEPPWFLCLMRNAVKVGELQQKCIKVDADATPLVKQQKFLAHPKHWLARTLPTTHLPRPRWMQARRNFSNQIQQLERSDEVFWHNSDLHVLLFCTWFWLAWCRSAAKNSGLSIADPQTNGLEISQTWMFLMFHRFFGIFSKFHLELVLEFWHQTSKPNVEKFLDCASFPGCRGSTFRGVDVAPGSSGTSKAKERGKRSSTWPRDAEARMACENRRLKKITSTWKNGDTKKRKQCNNIIYIDIDI